ncbi:hypothetical protein [Asaia bogorensis]|uniref:hypothetical protein n=1 Tax=Asaia bogorensis TaxID=91915 RepID=UPI0028604EAD|nr:hypothetical protein [Asaia bogorensis]MDR6183779.1 hypothetical protein [Asaia bogorensis NBRC 16594]
MTGLRTHRSRGDMENFTLGHADFREEHARVIKADAKSCLDAAEAFEIDQDWLIRLCLALRDLPGRVLRGRESHRFSKKSFVFLGREGDRFLRYGLSGQFWRADYGLSESGMCTPEAWQAACGLTRLLLEFEARSHDRGTTYLVTRTLISCPEDAERRKMALYWALIRPVSGLIRHRILRAIAHQVSRMTDSEHSH